jgi:hypothetical protein
LVLRDTLVLPWQNEGMTIESRRNNGIGLSIGLQLVRFEKA